MIQYKLAPLVIERLRELQSLKTGDPMPAWLGGPGGWGEPLSKLAGEAADLLESYAGNAL